jgi:hypothetical protein
MRGHETATRFDTADTRHADIHQDKIRSFNWKAGKHLFTAASSGDALNPRYCPHSTPNRFASQWRIVANKYGGHREYTSFRSGATRVAAAASRKNFGTHR